MKRKILVVVFGTLKSLYVPFLPSWLANLKCKITFWIDYTFYILHFGLANRKGKNKTFWICVGSKFWGAGSNSWKSFTYNDTAQPEEINFYNQENDARDRCKPIQILPRHKHLAPHQSGDTCFPSPTKGITHSYWISIGYLSNSLEKK